MQDLLSRLAAVLLAVIFAIVSAANLDRERDGRFFVTQTVTSTKTEMHVLNHFTPSSCIQMATSLPNCSYTRNVEPSPPISSIQPSKELRTLDMLLPRLESAFEVTDYNKGTDLLESSEVELAVVRAMFPEETVWETVTKTEVRTVTDPRATVTFSIVGCKPSVMPFNLQYCNTSKPGQAP